MSPDSGSRKSEQVNMRFVSPWFLFLRGCLWQSGNGIAYTCAAAAVAVGCRRNRLSDYCTSGRSAEYYLLVGSASIRSVPLHISSCCSQVTDHFDLIQSTESYKAVQLDSVCAFDGDMHLCIPLATMLDGH